MPSQRGDRRTPDDETLPRTRPAPARRAARGWCVWAALGLAGSLALPGAAQRAPSLRASLAALAAPEPGHETPLPICTLCESAGCGCARPIENVPRHSAGSGLLIGAATGLALGGLLAGDEAGRGPAPGAVRWPDAALMGAGAYFAKGRDVLVRRTPPPLGGGRWTDCRDGQETLAPLDGFFRDRLAGRRAQTRDQLQRALRRRARAEHWSNVALGTTLALPVGFRLRAGGAEPWREGLLHVEAGLLSGGLTSLAKRHFHRPRPFALRCEPVDLGALDEEDAQQSFFSGHTSTAFALATTGWRIAGARGDRHAGTLKGVGLALASLTGLLRIAADKHYVTDVVVGAAVGFGSGVLITKLHEPGRATARPVAAAQAARTALTPSTGLTFGLPRGLRLQAGLVAGGPALALSF